MGNVGLGPEKAYHFPDGYVKKLFVSDVLIDWVTFIRAIINFELPF